MVFYIYSLQHVQCWYHCQHGQSTYSLDNGDVVHTCYIYAQTLSKVNIQDVHGQGHYLGANMHEQIMFDAVSSYW